METICRLCKQPSQLQLSHIIPSFVFKWLKDSSVTGFLRFGGKPDKRAQDGHKEYLFCNSCEQIISRYEQRFATLFFYPYVENVLDESCNFKLDAKPIDYDVWLLKFIISIQWRTLFMQEDTIEELEHEKRTALQKLRENWREFLLTENLNLLINNENYLIPLCSLVKISKPLPSETHKQVNQYLLRSVDLTIADSKETLMIYSKIGPIAFVTAIIPDRFSGMDDLLIKVSGNFNFVFKLQNGYVGQFVYMTRANEVMAKFNLSSKSKDTINKSYQKNSHRVRKSLTTIAQIADYQMKVKPESKKNPFWVNKIFLLALLIVFVFLTVRFIVFIY